ncbi:unnamed protein product [Strongylus vulgaris]|uniref:NECAP PHear domain-containing protein n=1 Tax=Strongylus vulgaris TaxID=40348 RepID=A0A3P7IUG3_STRVU|nr:unnamed protein product [Strongylus vulgaris]
MEEEYESIALVKPEIFVYRIPPLGTNRGHKAADWKLDAPDWTGRMKLVAIGRRLELRLEDKTTALLSLGYCILHVKKCHVSHCICNTAQQSN